MVAWLKAGNALADFLYNAGTFMAQHGREVTFGISTGERVSIGMANACRGHFNQHFPRLRAFNIDLNQFKRLTRFQCNSCA